MLDPAGQLALRERPTGRWLMLQCWSQLLFLHFTIEPEALRRLVPSPFDLDLYPDASGREMAWVGLVPFSIDRVVFPPKVKVPTAHRFLETNLRTYVHLNGRDPGVWFFSLDAASALACKGARIFFGLPYWHAMMEMEVVENRRIYEGTRKSRHAAAYRVHAEVERPIGAAKPGTLEFFLAERYLLYSIRKGKLCSGQVHHDPYPLHEARPTQVEETMTKAVGIAPKSYSHAMFSPRVDVQVFKPHTVSG